MLNFKNIRLSMAQPSHVITIDCMINLLHRARRAGSVPPNSPDHFANDALLHGGPSSSYASPCWNNSCLLLFRLSGIREPNVANQPHRFLASADFALLGFLILGSFV